LGPVAGKDERTASETALTCDEKVAVTVAISGWVAVAVGPRRL
jgi:hypothetical protein